MTPARRQLSAAKKTELEDALAREFDRRGIQYQRQFKYALSMRSPTGRPKQNAADFAIQCEQGGYRLLVEVEGGVQNAKGHGRASMVVRDIARGNAAAFCGWRVVRIHGGKDFARRMPLFVDAIEKDIENAGKN